VVAYEGIVSANILAVFDGVTLFVKVTIPPKADVLFIMTSQIK
jgi:hypothetical protein